MPANPHFYLHTFLRGLVTATADEALNGTEHFVPFEVVDQLYKALEDLNGILESIADHLYEDDPGPEPDDEEESSDELHYSGPRSELPDFVQQELNYYAGLEL